MKIFLSGKMTGLPNFNRPLFNRMAEQITNEGHTVLNPAILPNGLSYDDYIEICLTMLECAEEVWMLPQWESSDGACKEREYAQRIDKPIRYIKRFCTLFHCEQFEQCCNVCDRECEHRCINSCKKCGLSTIREKNINVLAKYRVDLTIPPDMI